MAVQRAVAERWKKVTGVTLVEAYGLTETSPAACINPLDLSEYNGAIGLPICSTDASVQDDDGNLLGVGQVGELCIKGPQVMKGYWQRPEETAKVLTSDGGEVASRIAVTTVARNVLTELVLPALADNVTADDIDAAGDDGCYARVYPRACSRVIRDRSAAHAVARIFPQLERDLRQRTDFGAAMNAQTGVINHRGEGHDLAVDGQAGSSQPFFLFYNISPPHCPLSDAPAKYLKMYSPESIQLRPNVDLAQPLPGQDHSLAIAFQILRGKCQALRQGLAGAVQGDPHGFIFKLQHPAQISGNGLEILHF